MGANLVRKTTALLAAMAATLALVAAFALPQTALAEELAAGELSTQSAYTNTSLANAMELPYAQTYTGTFDYTDDGEYWEDYWFKFKTSNRNSEYVAQLDSVSGREIYYRIYDDSGNIVSWTRSGGGEYFSPWYYTTNRVSLSTSNAKKNSWYYVQVAHRNAIRYDQYRLTVYEKKALTAENVAVTDDVFNYDGSAKRPAVTVTYNGQTLIKDTDYYVDYINNVNAGSGTVRITGMGDNFTGEVSKTFAIEPVPAKPTLKLTANSYTYDGYTHKPDVIVKSGSTTLNSDNYDVTYPSSSYQVGTYTVKITCKGNYTGTAAAKYTIKPAATKLTGLSKLKKGFTASWDRKWDQVTGYQLQYSTNSSFKSGNKTVTVKNNYTTSKTVKKLASKKKYYVRVRTYMTVDGTKYYSAWSAKRSVKTK